MMLLNIFDKPNTVYKAKYFMLIICLDLELTDEMKEPYSTVML